MSPFEQITHFRAHFAEPTISLGKTNIFFNKACAAAANLHVMKVVDIFWDEANRVLKLKPNHVRGDNSFMIFKPNPSTWLLACTKFIHRIKPKTTNNGPLHIPVRWDEKEKAFIAVVPRTK
jgi:hypothetical protein